MLVKLKRAAFIGGNRYRPDPFGTTIPDRFRKQLPSDAEILSDPELELEEMEVEETEPELPLEPAKTLGELAHRSAAETKLPEAPRAAKAK